MEDVACTSGYSSKKPPKGNLQSARDYRARKKAYNMNVLKSYRQMLEAKMDMLKEMFEFLTELNKYCIVWSDLLSEKFDDYKASLEAELAYRPQTKAEKTLAKRAESRNIPTFLTEISNDSPISKTPSALGIQQSRLEQSISKLYKYKNKLYSKFVGESISWSIFMNLFVSGYHGHSCTEEIQNSQ